MIAGNWHQVYLANPTQTIARNALRYQYASPYNTDGTSDFVGLEQDVVNCMFPCRVVAVSNLNATYNNGAGTLTNAGAQAALLVDSITLSVNDRVLVVGQSSAFQNGIFYVSNTGSVSTNWTLTRDTDFVAIAQMRPGRVIPIMDGTSYGGSKYTLMNPAPVTIGTSAINFTSEYGLALTALASYLPLSDLAAGIQTFLGAPSSANLLAAMTTSTGTGNLVFAISPSFTTPALGTPSALVLTNATGLPLTTGVTGVLGTANGGTNLNTFTASGIFYASSSSVMAQIAVVDSAVLVTSAGGVPSLSTTLPSGLSVPGYLALSGGTMSGTLNMGSNTLTGLTAPVNASDAVTKVYADSIAAGFNPIEACYAASTANLTSWTYNNGTAGVGATLTAPGNGVFTVDGVTPAVGTRFLYKNDTTGSGAYNGIYTVTTSSAGSPAVLTRATDYNTPGEIQSGDLIAVEAGMVNAGSSWYQTATVVTIGTSAISFSVFFSPANFISSTLTSGTILIGNGSNVATQSSSTWPSSTTINQLLYSSATNTVTGLATVAAGVLTTVSSVPTWASELSLALGGTNNSLTASAGGILWSDSSKLNIMAGTATAGLALLSGDDATPTWSNNPPITKINVQVISATGAYTYTPTAGTQFITAEFCGGGGGSGGVASASNTGAGSGGGGAGGYFKLLCTAANIGASITGSIGIAGTAGSTGANNGGDGGNTTFIINSSTWTAAGGTHSIGVSGVNGSNFSPGGAGGANTAGSNATIIKNIPGQKGGAASWGSSGSQCISGNGGNNLLGFGGLQVAANAGNTTGNAALGNGGGGSGSASSNVASTNSPGAAGTAGILIITEFIST